MIELQRPVRTLVLTGFIVCLLSTLAACSEPPPVFHASGSTMGTTYSVKIADAVDSAKGESLRDAFDALLLEVNQTLSTYIPDSELSRFNQSQETGWQASSEGLMTVVTAAQSISTDSDGAFDVTVGPLVNLWGFGPEFKPDQRPDEAEIDRARARIGYHHLHTDESQRLLKKDRSDLYVDLSAIAKGYGVDRLAAYLDSQGFHNYLVEIGGEVFCKGYKENGDHWQIAVEKPLVGERSILRVVPLADQAMATSGNYRNFFELDGTRYAHTLNPQTGWPVQHDLLSVTVLSSSTMQADGWATALMVLGVEKGYDLAMRKNLAVLFVRGSESGIQQTLTPAFEDYLKGLEQ